MMEHGQPHERTALFPGWRRAYHRFGVLPAVMLVLGFGGMGASAVLAQTSGKLRMLIDPGNSYEFIVDHEFRMQQREVELSTGPHHLSFWAPQRMVVDTTINVEAGQTKNVVLRLPFSKQYLVYQRDLQQYQRRMKMYRVVPAAVTGGAALYTVLSYAKAKKAHDQLDEDREAYEDNWSPHRISELKSVTIPDHKDDFKKANTRFKVAAGVTVLFAGATAYLFHKSGKLPRPSFIDTEKLRFDGLSWIPGPHGNILTGGLTWNFTR